MYQKNRCAGNASTTLLLPHGTVDDPCTIPACILTWKRSPLIILTSYLSSVVWREWSRFSAVIRVVRNRHYTVASNHCLFFFLNTICMLLAPCHAFNVDLAGWPVVLASNLPSPSDKFVMLTQSAPDASWWFDVCAPRMISKVPSKKPGHEQIPSDTFWDLPSQFGLKYVIGKHFYSHKAIASKKAWDLLQQCARLCHKELKELSMHDPHFFSNTCRIWAEKQCK